MNLSLELPNYSQIAAAHRRRLAANTMLPSGASELGVNPGFMHLRAIQFCL